MSEELASLHIALKAMGLQETTRGVEELDRVLKATGLTAEQLAKSTTKVNQAYDQLKAGNTVLLQLFREGEATATRYATQSERLAMQLESVNQQYRAGALGTTAYNRAVDDLNAKLAVLEGRASSLSSRPPLRIDVPAGALEMSGFRLRMGQEQARQDAAASNFVPLGAVEQAAKEAAVEAQITQAKQQQIAVLKQQTAENERMNGLRLQGLSLERQMETAQEANNRRMVQYNLLLKEGIISQQTFNRASANSSIAMRSQSALGGKGMGQAMFQGGYAIQDLATVLAMGGSPGMAIMSAQNNLSQMLMVMTKLNPLMVTFGGTAAALAAIGVGIWWDQYNKGAEEAAERTKKVADNLKKLSDILPTARQRFEQAFDSSRAAGKMNPEQLADRDAELGLDARRGQGSLGAIQAERDRVRGALEVQERIKASEAGQAGAIAAVQNLYSAFAKNGATPGPVDVANAQAGGFQSGYVGYMNGILGSNEQYQGLLREELKLQEDLKRIEADRAEIARRMPEAEAAAAAQRRAKRAMSAQDMLDSMLRESGRSAAIAAGTATAAGFEAEDDLKAFMDNLGRAAGMGANEKGQVLDEFVGNQRRNIQSRIDDLMKQDAGRPREASFQSFSSFGQSLQLSLLKPQDEAKEQRKRQIKLMEDSLINLEKIRESSGRFAVMAP